MPTAGRRRRGARRAGEASRKRYTFSAVTRPKSPAGRTKSTRMRKPKATASRQLEERVADHELLDQAQEKAAHHRARHVADAAQSPPPRTP